MWRSIGAVVAGYAAWTVIWLAANVTITNAWGGSFDERGGTSDAGVLLLILAISVLASLVSGRVAAVAASRSPLGHALVLGILLLATGVGVQASAWDLLPVWFHLPFLALIVPANLLAAMRWTRRPAGDAGVALS